MDPRVDEEVQAMLQSTLAGMRDFCADGEAFYDNSHVTECERVLNDFLDVISRVDSAAEASESVRRTVEELNALNERCEHQLIETGQREGICAVIIRAGFLRGFNGESEDVTEAWREW